MTPAQQEKIVRETLGGEGVDVLVPLFKKAYPERDILDLLRLDFVFRGLEIDYIAKRSALNGLHLLLSVQPGSAHQRRHISLALQRYSLCVP